MALNTYQQAYDLFGKRKSVLIIAGAAEVDDTYPAALSIAQALKKINKEVGFFFEGAVPEYFYFLKDPCAPKKTISCTQDIVVSVDISEKPVKHISYKQNGTHLDIRIVPEKGSRIQEEDVHVQLGDFRYDLITTVGLADLESLGEEFERNASFFFETPIINIDKNSSNERYGEVNIIELTSSSCAEIVTNLLKEWDETLVDKKIATSLLAGIIASTNNFQSARTTPKTLFASAHLMSQEGNQQEIIKNIFKTKSFEFLKLWGITMSKLQFKKNKKMSWLTLTKDDFAESGASPKAIPLILTELKNNFSQADTFVIFWEAKSSYLGLINTLHEESLTDMLTALRGKKCGKNLLFSTSPKKKRAALVQVSRALDKYTVE